MKEKAQMIQNAVYDKINNIWYKSSHRWDYVSIDLPDGGQTFIDGGDDYRRTSVNFNHVEGFEDWVLYENDLIEKVKERLLWGTYGKNGTDPLRWVPLSQCSTEHLYAILNTQHHISDLFRVVIEEILKDRGYGR